MKQRVFFTLACVVAVARALLAVSTLAQESSENQRPANQSERDLENEVKAAYIYNFGLYVQWPKAAVAAGEDRFVIGVLGHDQMVPFLERVAKTKLVQGKKISVSSFKTASEYKPCHILFLPAVNGEDPGGESAEQRLKRLAFQEKGRPPLVVGDAEGLAQQGAMINFYVENNRVKFEINHEAAKQAGLQISPKLLKLGRIVSGDKGNG